jgi:DNA-binding NarL/FixJ family response regulator
LYNTYFYGMPTTLNKRDLLRAFNCVQEIALAANHDEFVASLIRVMHPLMHAKITGYNETDTVRKRFAFVVHPRSAVSDAMIRAWVEHAHENPLLQHAQQNPSDFSVHKITDLIPQKLFRNTSLCRKIYQKFGAEYQIALLLPSADSAVVAMVFNRAQDFDERDRQMLTLLQPVVSALYAHIQKTTERQVTDHSETASKPRPGVRRELKKFRLSPRELDVLRPLLKGDTNKQIAAHLQLSTRTVEKYVEHLLHKLNVSTRAAVCAQYQCWLSDF